MGPPLELELVDEPPLELELVDDPPLELELLELELLELELLELELLELELLELELLLDPEKQPLDKELSAHKLLQYNPLRSELQLADIYSAQNV